MLLVQIMVMIAMLGLISFISATITTVINGYHLNWLKIARYVSFGVIAVSLLIAYVYANIIGIEIKL